MFLNSEGIQLRLIYFIVNFGMSGKVIHKAKACGIQGSTVFLGKGTINNPFLDYIGLSDIRKEIVLMIADCETADRALITLNQHFKLEKPNHGIAFSIDITKVIGTRRINSNADIEKGGCDKVKYHMITTIVDKGKADEVICAAKCAGAIGGTIINGRGSGVHETAKFFMMDIEPEKEIVMILSDMGISDAIVEEISTKLKINEPGNGIIFVQDVANTYGIFK